MAIDFSPLDSRFAANYRFSHSLKTGTVYPRHLISERRGFIFPPGSSRVTLTKKHVSGQVLGSGDNLPVCIFVLEPMDLVTFSLREH